LTLSIDSAALLFSICSKALSEFKGLKMVFALDTLGYAKHLRDHGVPSAQAEAHAEAARDFIMGELVTKLDLEAALDRVALRMTLRFGVMLVAGLGALAAILKLA
jgi:hypothetical protein